MGEPASIDRIQEAVRGFAAERDRKRFHTPRNLTLALVAEVGELAELLQFRTDAEVATLAETPEGLRALGDKLADVLIYLTRLADVLSVDLGAATFRKLEDNATRYSAAEVPPPALPGQGGTAKSAASGTPRLTGAARTAAAKRVVQQREKGHMTWRAIAAALPGGPYAPGTARALYDEVRGAGAHHGLLPGKGGRRPAGYVAPAPPSRRARARRPPQPSAPPTRRGSGGKAAK